MIILLIAAVGILVHKEESEAKVKTGRLKEQMWFVEEGQEFTDISYTLILGYRLRAFIPVMGIYIQGQLVSKFYWHYCPP